MKLFDLLLESLREDSNLTGFGYPQVVIDYLKEQFGEKYYFWVGKQLANNDPNTQKVLADYKEFKRVNKSNPEAIEKEANGTLKSFRFSFELHGSVYTRDSIKNLINKLETRKDPLNIDRFTIEELVNKLELEAMPPDNGIPMVQYPNGFKWINLNVPKSEYEKAHMEHCGTSCSQGGIVWSLRDDKQIPYTTIEVVSDGSGFKIVQVKGKKNTIPTKTRGFIIDLLKKPFIHGLDTMTEPRTKERDFSIIHLTDEELADIQKTNPNFVVSEKELAERAAKIELYKINPIIKQQNILFKDVQLPELQRQINNILTELSIQYPNFLRIFIPKEGKFTPEEKIYPIGSYPEAREGTPDKTFEIPEMANLEFTILFVYVQDFNLGQQSVENVYLQTGDILQTSGVEIITDKVAKTLTELGLQTLGNIHVTKIAEFLSHRDSSIPELNSLPQLPRRAFYHIDGFRVWFTVEPARKK
jgi:hypothetical protein